MKRYREILDASVIIQDGDEYSGGIEFKDWTLINIGCYGKTIASVTRSYTLGKTIKIRRPIKKLKLG